MKIREEAQIRRESVEQLLIQQKTELWSLVDKKSKSTPDELFNHELDQLVEADYNTSRVRQTMANNLWKQGWEPDASVDGRHDYSAGNADIGLALSRTLKFSAMHHREEAIPKAYEDTFKWIFEDPRKYGEDGRWSSFPRWLESSENDVCWITGKAGSGKSTLMKFMTQSDRLQST